MTYAWMQDVPITREIVADLGDQPPEGLIVHDAQVMDDGHLRYLDVWESEQVHPGGLDWPQSVHVRMAGCHQGNCAGCPSGSHRH
jgi:hypothetical protein